jgi:hypothetical protein
MKPKPELDPKLDALLQELRHSTPRNPEIVSQARQAFLTQAAQMAQQVPRVSISTPGRLNRWKENLKTIWFGTQKEQKPMLNLFMSVLLVLGVVFGGGATTIAAAQAAQPNETLYPVKTWSEDVRLGWVSDPQEKLDLALQFSTRRVEEIKGMFAVDATIPEPVMTRFENQQQQVLDLAAGMPDDLIIPALERVRDQARQQEQIMAQLHVQDQANQQIHNRIQNLLQSQEQMAGQGIHNPDLLRQQLRQHGRNHNWLLTPTAEVTEPGQTPLPGSNPWTTGTPTPCSGYGPGGSRNPWTTGTPTPGSGYGTGESQNPWMDGTPTPGSGYGPGPGAGDCTACTPKPQNGNPTGQPGSGGGSGSGGGGGGSGQPAPSQSLGGGGNGNKP